MELSKFSIDRIRDSFGYWHVEDEYAEPMFNYLIYGIEPGSFFTSVLANDFFTAMCRSHPSNSIPALKYLAKWIINACPNEAVGSYDKVTAWMRKSEEERRKILEHWNLIFPAEEETWKVLNEPV